MVYQHNSFFLKYLHILILVWVKTNWKGILLGPACFTCSSSGFWTFSIVHVFMESEIPICPLGFIAIVTTGKKLRFDFQSNSLPITVPVASAAPQIWPPHPQFLPSFLLGSKPEKSVALHLHSQLIITGLGSTPLFLSSALLCDELNALEAGNTGEIFLQQRCHHCVGTCNSLWLL